MCNNVIVKSQVQLLPWQGRGKKYMKITENNARQVIQQQQQKRQTRESTTVVEIHYIDDIDHDT